MHARDVRGARMALHLLVVEGNIAEDRDAYRAGLGMTAGEAYAATLVDLAPDAICDICFPADVGVDLPDSAGLESYDGVLITGSALNLYDGGPAITRQIDLARAIFASETPFFGSCWACRWRPQRRAARFCAIPGGAKSASPARSIRPTRAARILC